MEKSLQLPTASGAFNFLQLRLPMNIAGHDYDVSGIFVTNPRDAPGPGEL